MTDNIYINILIEYLIVFVVLFILNYIFFVRKNKRYNKNKIPIELLYLVRLYNLVIKKINYKRFVITCSIINTFIVSTVYIIINYLINSWLLKIIIGIVLLVLFIIVCYGLLGRYYMKKEGK